MDAITAQWVARRAHAGQLSRTGRPMIDHVERVVARVPPDARTGAYLHDVLERSDWTVEELRAHGMTSAELSVLRLLTRGPDEPYDVHVMRIARARGPSGRMARAIKLADLNDHLSDEIVRGSPDYAWAWGRIDAAISREDVAVPGARRRAAAA